MRLFIIAILILNSLSFALDKQEASEKRLEKNIKEQLEREKKYSEEKTFYKGSKYNLKDYEVDQKLVDSIPEQEDTNADFDMNDTYD